MILAAAPATVPCRDKRQQRYTLWSGGHLVAAAAPSMSAGTSVSERALHRGNQPGFKQVRINNVTITAPAFQSLVIIYSKASAQYSLDLVLKATVLIPTQNLKWSFQAGS